MLGFDAVRQVARVLRDTGEPTAAPGVLPGQADEVDARCAVPVSCERWCGRLSRIRRWHRTGIWYRHCRSARRSVARWWPGHRASAVGRASNTECHPPCASSKSAAVAGRYLRAVGSGLRLGSSFSTSDTSHRVKAALKWLHSCPSLHNRLHPRSLFCARNGQHSIRTGRGGWR